MTAERRKLLRIATLIAWALAPIAVVWFYRHGISLLWSGALALVSVAAYRGLMDQFLKRVIETPDLFIDSSVEERTEDALARRRLHFWKKKFRLLGIILLFITLLWLMRGGTWTGNAHTLVHLVAKLKNPQLLQQLIILPIFFLANFALFFGPMMMMGISQMKSVEPGDADFGVKLEDVRGQMEAKAEIKKVVTLWQSGTKFLAAGGKRERGVLFLGPPGTGKTMLAKAIATGFNCPIVMMPGSGFAQTFIGMDVIIVRFMAHKARKLAAKWAGSCIVFIDEIDAVGMRRAALGNSSLLGQMPGGGMGGMMGGMGQMGLQSLLVVMDGIDNPPFLRKVLTNKVNLYLDALYFIPQEIKLRWGSDKGTHGAVGTTSDKPYLRQYKTLKLRLPKAKPTGNQIFFVGATNVPLESLDPALTRPGRMGRHIHFRTPTKKDRLDIFDLYLGKVAHDPELDSDKAREELARVTDGYSPASIEQVCSLALSYAHHSERGSFSRQDILEAMVTVEAGMALGWGYESGEEERSTAIHEAGHAVCSYLFEEGTEAIRLSVRKRGQTGGHLQSVESIERFAHNRAELNNRMVTILGAYAAEFFFYGHNTQGVGGDLGQASTLAAYMVGQWGMAPMPLHGADEKYLMDIGNTLVQVARPGDIPMPPGKARSEAMILGQAFVVAYNAIRDNKTGIEKIVATLVQKKEIYGDDLTQLLESCSLEAPEFDWLDDKSYPVLGAVPSQPKPEEV